MRWAAVLTISALGICLPAAPAAGQGCRTGPCHRDVGRSAVVHDPVAGGECDSCHKGAGDRHPQGEGPEFSLRRDGGGLCYECHGEIGEEAAAARVVHDPVRRGACLECHRSHESDHESLLRERSFRDRSGNQPRRMPMDIGNFALCWLCHDKYIAVMPATAAKTGFRDGSRNLHYLHLRGEEGYLCGACHRPHSSGGEKLVGRPMDWTDDLVGFTGREGGGFCATACHEARAYRRDGAEKE